MPLQTLSEKKVCAHLDATTDAPKLAAHFGLSRFWELLVFSPGFETDNAVSEFVIPTEFGNELVQRCCNNTSASRADSLLALYGHFYWLDILIDCTRSDLAGMAQLLSEHLLNDRVRIPYIWGRALDDKFADHPEFAECDLLAHIDAWGQLTNTPIGVFQHGHLISGPLGIIESAEHRWLPLTTGAHCYYMQGTKRLDRIVRYDVADIGVVKAHGFLRHFLSQKNGSPSEWSGPLAWYGSNQDFHRRTDYSDIASVIGDCVLQSERTVLLEKLLKTEAGNSIRNTLKRTPKYKAKAGLSPLELASSLNEFEQFQLLLVLPTESLVVACDNNILDGSIDIPPSEVRYPRHRIPRRGTCFSSELSSLGIRPAHTQPFAGLCSTILRAYEQTDSSTELGFRLGSDPSRGLQVSLTEFVRREGPSEAVERLILASHSVTTVVCKQLLLKLEEILPRTKSTIPRILWRFGFEIPRHDEILERLTRRIIQFEEMVSTVDLQQGESAREKIRAEGVNLFVSVEEFLDRVLAFNAWMLSSDHWGTTRYQYRLNDARFSVATVLGNQIDGPNGPVDWKVNGENTLGTQLVYLQAFEQWLDRLGDLPKHLRYNIDSKYHHDEYQRPFPFRHIQLWADSDPVELERYREMFKKVVKVLGQADIAGIRNALDHQRDSSRFPLQEKLELCISRLKTAVRLAEQTRIYPVTFWFDSKIDKAFGSSESIFQNSREEKFSIHRPSTVSSLPGVTRISPVVFAPVNFLGAADSLLSFTIMGESTYSRYWANYPRIYKTESVTVSEAISQNGDSRDIGPLSTDSGDISQGGPDC